MSLTISEKLYLPYLEFHVVDHCNLNCRGCAHFCPLNKKEKFHDPQLIHRDLTKLAESCKFDKIRIMGGEPLLHPNISTICASTREIYNDSTISLVTNGIMLPAMKDDFWDTLRKYNIRINISHYPVVKNFQELTELVIKKNVQLNIVGTGKFSARIVIPAIKGNIEEKYQACTNKACVNLYEGRLYPCPMSLFIPLFNDAFNEFIPAHNGIDIYTCTKDNIQKLTSTPFITCEYCNFKNPRIFEWGISNCEENEWLIYDKKLQHVINFVNIMISKIKSGIRSLKG